MPYKVVRTQYPVATIGVWYELGVEVKDIISQGQLNGLQFFFQLAVNPSSKITYYYEYLS
jgi:hypothetical protein